MKVARTVRSGGKAGDNINSLPITNNVNRNKGVFNCPRCGANGKAIGLFARAKGYDVGPGTDWSAISKELREAINGPSATFKRKPKKRYENKMKLVQRASDVILNETYSAMLRFKYFALSEEHRADLLRRGLDDGTIKENGYRSIDEACAWVDNFPKAIALYEEEGLDVERKKFSRLDRFNKKQMVAGMILAESLLAAGCRLEGVPGFYQLKKRWFFNLSFGMLIPTRSAKGRIVSFQVRTQNKNLRYLTLSSKDLPKGVSERIARVHFPLHNTRLNNNVRVFITEGPLKADVAQCLLGNQAYFIAIPGVSYRDDLPVIFNFLNQKGIKGIINALDMDKVSNANVLKNSMTINRLAKSKGLRVRIKYWDEAYCLIKYKELLKIAKKNGVSIPSGSRDDVFFKTELLTATLAEAHASAGTRKKSHKTETENWRNETKGIDDYLLSLKQHASEATQKN